MHIQLSVRCSFSRMVWLFLGTESSQSSDDSTSSVHGVARKEQTISVPESTLTTHQIRSDTVLGEEN